jgi:hypothetical protein
MNAFDVMQKLEILSPDQNSFCKAIVASLHSQPSVLYGDDDDSNDAYTQEIMGKMETLGREQTHLRRINSQDDLLQECIHQTGIPFSDNAYTGLGDSSREKFGSITANFSLSLKLFAKLCATSFQEYKPTFSDHTSRLKDIIDPGGKKIQEGFSTERAIYIICLRHTIKKHFDVMNRHMASLFDPKLDSVTLRLNWEKTVTEFFLGIDTIFQGVTLIGNLINQTFYPNFHDQAQIFVKQCLGTLVNIYDHRSVWNKSLTSFNARTPNTKIAFDNFVTSARRSFVDPKILKEEELQELVKPFNDLFKEVDNSGYSAVSSPVSSLYGGTVSVLGSAAGAAKSVLGWRPWGK